MAEKKPRATSRRAPAKKVAKKTTKKATSKSVAKKVASKKSLKKTTKKTTAKKSVKKATAKKSTKKKTAVKNDKSAKVSGSKKSKDAITLGTEHRVDVDKDNVTIFSRVKTDSAVMLVARVLGLAFIFLGAGATALGLGRSFEVMGVTALTVAITEQPLLVSGSSCSSTNCATSADSTNTMPTEEAARSGDSEVSFSLPSGVIAGTVTLSFTVTEASKLFARAESLDNGEVYLIGPAMSVDSSLWQVAFDTTTVPDGEYALLAHVTTPVGAYQDTSFRSISVQNNTAAVSIEAEAVSADAEEDNPSTSQQSLEVLTDLSNPLEIQSEIEIAITGASRVQASVIDSEDTLVNLGQARLVRPDVWAITLDQSVIEAGQYTLQLSMFTAEGSSEPVTAAVFTVVEPARIVAVPIEDATGTNAEDTVEETRVEIVSEYTEPSSKLVVSSDTATGYIVVLVEAENVAFTELYARQTQSLRDQFIGLARQTTAGTWQFVFDTTTVPNGTYDLFARHRTDQGYFTSNSVPLIIDNELKATSDEAVAYVEELQAVRTIAADPIKDFFAAATDPVTTEEAADEIESPLPAADVTSEAESEEPVLEELDTQELVVDTLLRDYETSLREELDVYAQAVRENNDDALRRSERRLDMIQDEIASAAVSDDRVTDIDSIDQAIRLRVSEVSNAVKKTEELVRDRVGEAITKDSDNDGITDFDEVALYQTDPFSADSDNDGFIDGAEIESGFDPNNDSQEAAILYESPKESGLVREDILVVEAVAAAPRATAFEVGTQPAAIISGRGLPNSFVTLFIFSTPIIITVKTDADGSWNYRFEKELEDGEHQVFVGVTDNAGKIVAKSEPFGFVKEAEAFEPVDAESSAAGFVATEPPRPSLFDQSTLMVALGGMIMALGFVLLLVSTFLRRQEEHVGSPQESKDLVHA